MKTYLTIIWILLGMGSQAQVRDTLKVTITKVERKPADTVYFFSSRVDTIAMQPLKTDTSKIVLDKNAQDLTSSKYKVSFKGSVRVNAYYDFDGMTSTEGFIPYDIDVEDDNTVDLSSVYIGARQSRFAVEGEANTMVGHIKTYMEVDFASVSNSFWRLRHAFAEWNYFKIGYTWSTFMDNASLPVTVDFEGPNSSLSKRHGLIRYERKFGDQNIAGFSIEIPEADYYNPADSALDNKSKQDNFDVAARYKYFNNWGHVQIAGVFRRINYLHKNDMDNIYGWGILLSAVLKINANNIIYSQISFGESIANYYVGFSRRQLDAIYNPNSDKMISKAIQAGFATYTHIFNPKWRFSLTGGVSFLENEEFETGDTFRSSEYYAGNFFFYPIETIHLGLEMTSGTRTNLDKQKGSATRISMISIFSF